MCFIKNSPGNVLDLVLSNISVDFVTPVIQSSVGIDAFHPPFEVIFCLPRKKKKAISRSYCTYKYAQGDYLSIYIYFENFNWSGVLAITEAETGTEKFSSIRKDAIDAFVPQKLLKPSIYPE